MKSYNKPALKVLTLGVAERVAIDACEGIFVPEGGGEYHWRIDGPSFEDFIAGKGNALGCIMTMLDGLTVS